MRLPFNLKFVFISLTILVMGFLYPNLFGQNLVINEVMSKNNSTIQDIDGEFPDWIEIYNGSNQTINLGGYSLSDNIDELSKWIFPSINLEPDSFLLVFASGKNYFGQELHSNFAISAMGESVFLANASMTLIDFIGEVPLVGDQSYGRIVDGGNQWTAFVNSSPGISNSFGLYEQVAPGIVVNEYVSLNSQGITDIDGEHSDWIELFNLTDQNINLENYNLSDDPDSLNKWTFPSVEIPANGFLLIFASGKNYSIDESGNEIHTNFNLELEGEPIILSNNNMTVLDYAPEQALLADQSFGRIPDGAEFWVTFVDGTANQSNQSGQVFAPNNSLVINEIMTSNTSTIEDVDGEYSDWIEFYNPSQNSINLFGYSITDDPNITDKWIFPNVTIEPNELLLIFASGKNYKSGELHTNFKLSSGSEDLILYNAQNEVEDFLFGHQLISDQSFGRIENGSNDWVEFYSSTPDDDNANGNSKHTLEFSHQAGQYPVSFDLAINADSENVQIFYSTNGNEPTPEDNLYVNPISIEPIENEPNYFCSNFSTTQEPYEIEENVYKINVVRARAFINGLPASKVYSKSYMIHPDFDRYTLPMISIVSTEENLFSDDKGIYVTGENFDGDGEHTMNCFQRGADWERPAHFEFFIDDELISQDGGLRVHGGGSRRNRQKSFRLYARNQYDSSDYFEHQFFESKNINKFKRLVLRAQDGSNSSYMSDEVMSYLMTEHLDEVMATRPVVAFVNGEFWGVYNLRERVDKYYLAENFNANKDSLDLLNANPFEAGCCVEGDSDEYIELLEYIENVDPNDPSFYSYIDSQIDIDQYLTYLITQLWAGNYDWPKNNQKYWKDSEAGSKWHWILFDLDFGLRFTDRPSIINFMNNLTNNTAYVSTLPGKLILENEQITERFLQLWEYHLNSTFEAENFACKVISYQEMMAPHMQESFSRFNLIIDEEHWNENVFEMYNQFAAFRSCEIIAQLNEVFDAGFEIPECVSFTPDETPCIMDDSPGEINQYPLEGLYTVGTSNSDFQSLEEVFDSLNSLGVNGTVTFYIESGIYSGTFPENSITQVEGAYCEYPVIFTALNEGEEVVFNYNDEINIRNTNSIIFDGITFGSTCNIENTDCLIFQNCNFQENVNVDACQNLRFSNNTFTDQSTFFQISTDIDISNNSFNNANIVFSSTNANGDSLDINTNISSNEFQADLNLDPVQANAILINFPPVSNNNFLIEKNKISGYYQTGLFFNGEDKESETGEILITNNLIGSQTNGIHFYKANLTTTEIFSNNILIKKFDENINGSGVGLKMEQNIINTFSFRNNCISNEQTGLIKNYLNNILSNHQSDFNNYFNDNNPLVSFNGSISESLVDWQETNLFDLHSHSFNPEFLSDTELVANNTNLFTRGDSQQIGTNDFHDVNRTEPVSIGAHENNNLLDIGLVKLVSPEVPGPSGNHVISIEAFNYGAFEVDGLTCSWSINEEFQNSFALNFLNIEPGQNIGLDLAYYNFIEGEEYFLKFWIDSPNGEIDQNTFNDTLSVFFIPGDESSCIAEIENIVLNSTVITCIDGSTHFTVESYESTDNDYYSNTFALLNGNTIVAISHLGDFKNIPYQFNYCVVGISYLEYAGLDYSSFDINSITNTQGLTASEGACIYVSECVPVVVNLVLAEPEILSIETHCLSPDLFEVIIHFTTINTNMDFEGSAIQFAESFEIINNDLFITLPISENFYDLDILSDENGSCGIDQILIDIPVCAVDNDAGIVEMINPNEEILAVGNYDLDVAIKNYGNGQLEEVSIYMEINNNLYPEQIYQASIPLLKNEIDTISVGSLSVEEDQEYLIKIWTVNPNGSVDEYIQNDTLVHVIKGVEDVGFESIDIKMDLEVFPNPAKDLTLIKFDLLSTTKYTIALFNPNGKLFYQKKEEGKIGKNTFELDVRNIPSGLYLIKVKIDDQVLSSKLIVD